jgi:GrpB-like predicted nucleotidyltransferase (UPF0157 family)
MLSRTRTLSLGLESGTVRVVAYDPTWPSLFAAEAERLRQCFAAAELPLIIEHTGSTAVPGLAAKPILDTLAGYHEAASLPAYVEVLTEAGYVHRGEQEIPGREFFRRGNPRAYHLHLTAIDSLFWRDHLTFRNRLRTDTTLRDAYADLKRDLAATFPRDREAYISGKESFVNKVLSLSINSHGAQRTLQADKHFSDAATPQWW